MRERKAKGGKIKSSAKIIERLREMLRNHDIDADDPEWGIVDDQGNFDIEEAKATLEDVIEGEREVDDLVGDDEPKEISKRIKRTVSRRNR